MTADGTYPATRAGEITTTAELDLRAFAGTLPDGGWALIELACGCPAVMVRDEDAPRGPAVEVRPVDLSGDDDPHDHDSRGWLSSRGVEYPVTVLFRPDAPQPDAVGDDAVERGAVLATASQALDAWDEASDDTDDVALFAAASMADALRALVRADYALAAARAGEAEGVELAELREMVAFLRSGVLNLSRDEMVQRITAVGSAEWRAGNWLMEHDAAIRKSERESVIAHQAAQRGGEAVDREDAEALAAIIERISDSTLGYRVDAAVLEGLMRVRDHLAARGDAAPTEVEWGVQYEGGGDAIGMVSESNAQTAVAASHGTCYVVERTVSAWREVTP